MQGVGEQCEQCSSFSSDSIPSNNVCAPPETSEMCDPNPISRNNICAPPETSEMCHPNTIPSNNVCAPPETSEMCHPNTIPSNNVGAPPETSEMCAGHHYSVPIVSHGKWAALHKKRFCLRGIWEF
jgi:hypothetical protein